MQKPTFLLLALATAMLGANVSVAAEQAPVQQKTQGKAQKELIYGSQLMTPQERTEYRAKMRGLKTQEEREALRMEHHQKMQERAKSMGKTLPDMPPVQGGGACSGAACGGTGGCCGSAGGCCAGMKHGGTGSEGGAACGAGGCCGGAGGCCGGMHGGMQHGGTAPQSGAGSEGGAAPQGGTAPEEHKH